MPAYEDNSSGAFLDVNDDNPLECAEGASDIDSDGDGVADCRDGCPTDPTKTSAETCGCVASDPDTDQDGTPDCADFCPTNPNKVAPLTCGCDSLDVDADGNGVLDCLQDCPSESLKPLPGACGCNVDDTDTDRDGYADCNETCDDDPNKLVPGICGCGLSDNDVDRDGLVDCLDLCPMDPNKIAPDVCDCGMADSDLDGDGLADCLDLCPTDPNKTDPGSCDCGISDVDSDHDGTPDCQDPDAGTCDVESTHVQAVNCKTSDDIGNCANLIDGKRFGSSIGFSCLNTATRAACIFPDSCPNGCIKDYWIRYDLAAPHQINRLEFISDWWAKRPDHYEVWVSNNPSVVPDAGAVRVASSQGKSAPYQCVQGEPCGDDMTVPDECCANGRNAPQHWSPESLYLPARIDILDFPGQMGQYWYLLIRDTQDPAFLEFFDIAFYNRTCRP